jgi:hypothetical protein
MKAILAMVFAAFVGVGLSGCVVRHHGEHGDGHDHGGVEVVVPSGHTHDDGCGHYYHRDRWYHHRGHRHGRNCGHHYVSGRWVIRL